MTKYTQFNKGNLFSTFLLFLLVFDLRIYSKIGSVVLVLLVLFLYIFSNRKSLHRQAFTQFQSFLVLYYILFLYTVFRVFINGVEELSYLLTSVKSLVILMTSLLYFSIFYHQNLEKKFFDIFFINSCICLLAGTFTSLKNLLVPFQYGMDSEISVIGISEYRNAFLAGSGYFGISSLYSLAFPFLLKNTLDNRSKLDYIKLFIIGLAGILAGRISIICYAIAIAYFGFIQRKLKLVIIYVLAVLLVIFLLNTLPALEGAKLWIYEMFEGDKVSDSDSAQTLKSMIYIPSNQITFLFGDGRYGDSNSYYGGTDSGFMRNWLFGGIVFVGLLIITFLSMFEKTITKNLTFTLLIVTICFTLHFKGIFIFNNPGFFPVLVGFLFIAYCRIQENQKV